MGPGIVAVRERLRSNLWLVPLLGVLLTIALSEAAWQIDQQLIDDQRRWFTFAGGSESARSLLSTIAASMITFTGLVFSITMLVLQLASSQHSPRVIRAYLRDLGTQVVLATFIASFVYALLTLRRIPSTEDASLGPSLSVWLAVALVGVSVLMFVYYIDHMAQSIRPISVIRRIGKETSGAIADVYPEKYGSGPRGEPHVPGVEPDRVVRARAKGGILISVDQRRLQELARDAGCGTRLLVPVGEFVPPRAPLFEVWGSAPDDVHFLSLIALNRERTMEQDPAFGFEQLLEIAQRALSPGINDPATAVQVINQVHILLSELLEREMPSWTVLGEGSPGWASVPLRPWDDYVDLSIQRIFESGADKMQVRKALGSMLSALLQAAPEERAPVLRRNLNLVEFGE